MRYHMLVAHRLVNGGKYLRKWKDLAQVHCRCVICPLGKVDIAQMSLLNRVIDMFHECEHIEERVTDAAIRPVEIDVIVVLYCNISSMQVTMYQRLRDCAIHQLLAHGLQLWSIGA